MRCPFCGHNESQVKDSRPSDDGTNIRRRRSCTKCHGRFTTFEYIQMNDLIVIKRNGVRVPFDREKLAKSIRLAVSKREIDSERINKIVSQIVRQAESMGEAEIKSAEVGKMVMEALLTLDKVSYVRYASVYKKFNKTQDFEDFIRKLVGEK
ncbi:MAG: transcriptional regulator NrdR [Lactobacillales bacterium]|jgi:transcriptional repressor NrdR|nr:transcriptional regulator NrdR [Lactobacillales bacterium]